MIEKRSSIFGKLKKLRHKIKTFDKIKIEKKKEINTLTSEIIEGIEKIIQEDKTIDPKTTEFEVTWNQPCKDTEGYFTVDFTYCEGEIYDPFIHPNFSLYSIDTKGSRYIDDTSVVLYVTYKYNPKTTHFK